MRCAVTWTSGGRWPNPSDWQVTPETARLLQHWRHHKFSGVRPFFCQVEAVETAIWLTEVAPQSKSGKRFLEHLASCQQRRQSGTAASRPETGHRRGQDHRHGDAHRVADDQRRAPPRQQTLHPRLSRRRAGSDHQDRLRVLQPNDPDSYYASRELVPGDMLDDVNRAKIVITNYHAFKLRERIELSDGRALLASRARRGAEHPRNRRPDAPAGDARPDGHEEHPRAQRRGASLLPREAEATQDDEELKGDEKKEAEKNNEAARLWISGLEAVNRKLGVARVIDLSATPFFLRGSGYAEGTLFPWTMSDFSLMDAIECGIVKLPRVPVADNIPGDEMPMFRNLWEHIRKEMPKKGRGKGGDARPAQASDATCRPRLQALYGHYEKTFELWEKQGIRVPPCFIVVCKNTAISKLVYDFISGFHREERGRHDHAGERPPRALPQLRRDTATRSRGRTRC